MGIWHPVVEFLGAIVGVDPDDWPGGDEDAMREYARQYDAIATELRTAVATGCREGATAVAAAWNGEAGRALSAQILAYGTDKEFGGVETIAAAAEELAQYLRDQADTIARAKVMILAQIAVGILMFAIPAGKALSLGMRLAFRNALKNFIHNRARGVIKQAISALAARAGRAMAMTPVKFFRGAAIAGVGAGIYGLAPNTIAQGYGVLTGRSGRTTADGHHAEGWDWDETKKYAAIAAVATPIAIVTGVGMAKLGGVATRNVSALNGRVPRFVGRRIAGATTMAVSMPAADLIVTHHRPTFEDFWKSAVMGAAVPGGGGSHGPAAGGPHGDPIKVEPVRDHPMIGGGDHPPPDPPQVVAKPGTEATPGTANAPTAHAGAEMNPTQNAHANAHSTAAEARTEAGAVGGVHTAQPAAGVGTPEASARSGSRADTTTPNAKTATAEHHTRTIAPEKGTAPEKVVAPPDKPPVGPEKSAVPDKPAEAGKVEVAEEKAKVPQVSNRQADPPAAKEVDQPAAAQPHAGEHARQEPAGTPEVRDWSGRREHQEEVQRREADATKARDEHQTAVETRKKGPATEDTQRAADQSSKELKDAERALDKHVKKHGDMDPRAHELRDQRDHAKAKDDTAQQGLTAAKDADAQVQNAKLAADARRVSYLAAKLDYTLSRLSPAEIRQLAEGKLNLVSEVRLTPEEARMLAIHELVHRTPDGWGFALNWTQIHADLALRSDLLVQMMTGEGKTAVAVLALGMTAAEHPVHFMTSNRSLAAQAHEKFRKVLEPLGYDVVQVDSAVRYGKPRRPTVYVGDVAAFGWSMGRGHRVPGEHVVVDEIDAVAVELATQVYTHSSGAAGEASAKTQAEVMLAKRALDSGKFDKSDFGLTNDRAAPKLTEAGRQKLAELIGVEPGSRRFGTHATRLEHAAQARWVLRPGRDYIRAVIEGHETILIVSKHSGEPLVDRETLLEQRWTGVAQALEARHGLDLRADAKHTNAVRTKDLLETYKHLSGMSGTAKDAGQAIRDLYGEDKIGRVVEIESFNERKLDIRPPQHFATVEEKYRAIVDQSIADLSKSGGPSAGRPQAIVVEHNDEVALVARLVEERLAEHQLSEGMIQVQQVNAEAMAKFIAEHTFDAKMDAIWKQAGKPGTITIGNKVLGRGIDIEVHPDAFNVGHRPGATDHVFTVKGRDGREAVDGGLAVRVGFHDAESPRGTIQALNRSGRQGAPGEASLYASHQDELFRRHSGALEAAVAYHDAPSTAARNEALRTYTEAAVAHAHAVARGEGSETAVAVKAAGDALKKAEHALAVGEYSAAIESGQLDGQRSNLDALRITHTTVAPDQAGAVNTPDRPDTLVPDMLRSAPSYQGLSTVDQLRVVDAIKQLTGNDPALVEGLRPLLESPGLRALEPVNLLAEVVGWDRYNDLFGRAVELDARITGSPETADVEHWRSHSWADATELGEIPQAERLSTSGRRGQIVTLDEHAGVYSIARDGAEWIVKLFPDKADEQQQKDIADEFAGVVAAAGTGYGPTPYGLVRATIDVKPYVGLAMGRVPGAMVHDPQPSEPDAIAEVERARRAVTFDTVLQLHQYLRRLLDGGHHSHGELQPLIDPVTGNLRVIDLADVLPLLDDPDYQRLARADHGLSLESMDVRDQLVKIAVENAQQDTGRARLLAAPAEGMSAGAVRQAVDAVRHRMRLPDGIALDVVVGADGEELAREYGITPTDGPRPGYFRMENGRGVIYLSAADHSTPADVRASLWHEIVGHYGWSLFSPEERAEILAAVHELRRLDAELSAEIDELYADQPDDIRDEEFLARLAEGGVPSRLLQAWNGVLSTPLGAALHRIGAISNEVLERARRDHELEPLYKILRSLVRAIRSNRPVYDATAGDRAARDRRVRADRAGDPGRIDRSEFRGDGRRMPDRDAVLAVAQGAVPRIAAAVAAARGEARDVAIEGEQIIVTLADGQRLTVRLDVSGIFLDSGPVRWERTAGATDWARINLSPRVGDEVVGRAVAHAVAGVLSAYRGESEIDQIRAGRRAEVGYLVQEPHRSRRELGHVLRQLNKLEGRRCGIPPLPRGLRQRVRDVLQRSVVRAWLAEEIDQREDQLTEPASTRPMRLPSIESTRSHAPDPAVDRFVYRLFQHFADQPVAESGLSASQQAVLRELPLFRQFVNWHGHELAAAFGRMDADVFAGQIAAADQQSVADAFARLRSLLDQRDNGHSWFQRSTAARQFAELADALGVVAHDNLRAALPHDLGAAVAGLEPGLVKRINRSIDNGVRSLPSLPADLSFRFLQTLPSGAVSAAVLAGHGQIGLAATVLTGAALAWPAHTITSRYAEARRSDREVPTNRRRRAAIAGVGIGVAALVAHSLHLDPTYLEVAAAAGAVQPVSLYAKYLRRRMHAKAATAEQRITAELDQNRATLPELKTRLANLETERQRLLQQYDARVPTELHQLTDVLVRISTTFTQYADAMQKAGLDPHTSPDGPEGRPVSASILHNDPIHTRNLTDLTWAPGRHHEPSVEAENAALIAAKIHQATDGRYSPLSLAQIQSHAAPGRGLLDIAADLVFAEEHRRTPSRALAARVDFHRSLTADQARAVPTSLFHPERPPLDWPTYAELRPNALQEQQTELTNRAAARTESAAKATDDAPKAARHTAIAEACTAAAHQADRARDAWQAYRDTPTPAMLQAARQQDALYEQRRAESLPPKDVLQTAAVSGQLPHLTALTNELNQALVQQNKTFRFTPELLHRTLRAETRRLLSPGGLVLTVGNDPRADVAELTQFELTLDPSELQEVLDNPVLIEEAQLGQLVQGGYSVGTTTTQSFSANGVLKLAPFLSGLPDGNPYKALAQVVSPSVEYSKNVGLSVTGGATEYGLPGAVEVIQGEIHRFRSSRPRWSWRMRTSAVDTWSARHVVAGGTTKDTATLELGISHAYTVGAPKETVRIPSDERRTDLPEHVATRVDGLSDLADRAIAGLRQRLGSLDRVGHDQLRGLLTEDAPGRLAEMTRPGGLSRIITSGGRAVAYAQLETVAVWERATLLGDSSKDHKVERLRVGFSGTSGGQTFSAGDSFAVSAGYGGTATQDLGTSSWDLGPGGKAGLNAGHDTSVNTGDTAIHPSVQRMQPTVGVKLRLEHRLTIHRVDRAGEFTLTAAGDAVLRMPENDAYRYGLPVPSAAIVRDQDGQPSYGLDGRRLLRGDPQPTGEDIQLPVWMHRGWRHIEEGPYRDQEGRQPIRGAGPALVQELSGADEALQEFLEHLSAKGLIPNGELGGKDPALAASQLANLERVGQQLARHRLETGYDPAAQEGIVLRLDRHRTGFPPELHTYRIRLRSYTGEAKFLGLSTGETVVNLDIGSNTTSRSGGQSRSLPWQTRFGFSDKPKVGEEGATPEIAPSYGRSSLGRFISWATGSTLNRVSLTESTAPVAVFDVPHTIVITEVGHESKPIVTVDGSARFSIDSEFCRRDGTEPTMAIEGEVNRYLLRSATFQAVDVGDLVGRLTAELPELARGDSSALHHLSAFLNPRNLAARPEMLTAPYSTSLLVTPAPSNVDQALSQRGVTTGRARLTVDTTLLNLRYVGSGHPVNGEINLTLGSSTITTGTSTSGTFGLGGGTGVVDTDGSSYGGSLSGNRSKDRSASSTETQIGGVERLAIRDGEHYQFWADLGVVAELRVIGAEPRVAQVRSGAVMLTLPERDALRLYGLGELDLPAAKVHEAVERLLEGDLHLPPRTILAIARRHTDDVQRERLAAMLRDRIGLSKADHPSLDAVLPAAQDLIERRTSVRMPEHYTTTMGAGLIDETSLKDPDNNETDLYREVLAAVEDSSREALDDPVLAAGLRGDLAGLRWHGHIDDLLSDSGFVTEYPTGDGRRVSVRIKLEFDGPTMVDGLLDKDRKENAFNIIQVYDYREESRSVTGATTYGGQVGGSLSQNGSGTAGVGTDLGTSTTASSTEQNTRMSRALWNPTKRVSRGYRMTVQVDGAEARNLTGEMTLLVPASVVNAPVPEAIDAGQVKLPRGTVVEGTIARKLFNAVYSRLGTPDMLTAEGARVHRTALENMLSAATRLAAFERIASPEGHTMVQLPVPGRRSRLVAVRVRAELSNLQLVAEGEAQLGQIDRQQRITQLTTKSNRLLPAARSMSGSNPAGIQAGLSTGEQVGEKSSDSTGNRNETTMNERGQVVTVKVDVDYHLRYEDRRLDRRGGFDVAATDTGFTQGTAYLTMFRHEYDALRGKPSTQPPSSTVAEGNPHTAGSIPPPNPSGAS